MKPALKTLMPIFALLAIALFAGCSQEVDDPSSGNYTITDDGSITAEPIKASELEDTSWTYTYIGKSYSDDVLTGTYTGATTLEFKSDGNVTVSYYKDDELTDEDSYTYAVDDSIITLYYADGYAKGKDFGQLVYASDKLIARMIFTQDGSSPSGNTINLAGTTWTCTATGTSSVNGVVESTWTNTYTLKFQSDGNVIWYMYQDDKPMGEGSYTYSVSGSTVTITGTIDGEVYSADYIYSSGKLIYPGAIYTKDS